MRHLWILGLVAVLVASGGPGLAQGQAPSEPQQSDEAAKAKQKIEATAKETPLRMSEGPRLVPLSVDVVVSKYQGEKKVSSLPYTLAVNANEPGGGQSQLRMGATVPVASIAAPKGNPAGPSGPMPGPVSYREIGTNIDCSARTTNDGGFQLRLSVEDTSVYTNVQDATTPTVGDMPVFRTFRSSNTLVLRDGQTREFSAATDRVSGEVVRIAVTLRVVK